MTDDAALPSALTAVHGIRMENIEAAMPKLLAALGTPMPEAEVPGRVHDVLARLGQIQATEPSAVVSQAKAVFAQHGWTVQGNVYQASGDIFLTVQQPGEEKTRSKIDPWVKVAGLIATILTIVISLFALSDTIRGKLFPKKPGEGAVTIRLTVLGPDAMPVEDAKVWSSIGGEVKKVAGGWELEIPLSKVPATRTLTIYAAQETSYLKGKRDVTFGDDPVITASLQLERETSAEVKGVVVDEAKEPIAGATVSIVGTAGVATTDAQGHFSLAAHAAMNEEVRLRIAKSGYRPVEQYHPAGETPAYIILERAR